jgi:hypothetical protein
VLREDTEAHTTYAFYFSRDTYITYTINNIAARRRRRGDRGKNREHAHTPFDALRRQRGGGRGGELRLRSEV